MKIFFWLLLCQLIISATYSQKFEPVNPKTDKRESHGYIIKLFPAFGNSYGYDIIKGQKLIVHQSHNPFTASPVGLSRKEDVYKIAEWQISQSEIERKQIIFIPRNRQEILQIAFKLKSYEFDFNNFIRQLLFSAKVACWNLPQKFLKRISALLLLSAY